MGWGSGAGINAAAFSVGPEAGFVGGVPWLAAEALLVTLELLIFMVE